VEDLMEYRLIFSPRVDLTASNFVVDWNSEDATQGIAYARLTSSTQQTYNPLVDIVSLVLTNVGLGLGTNALYDLIKKVVERKEPKKHIKITKLDQPDGTYFLTIDIDE